MKAFLSSISRNKRFVVAELFLVYFAHGLGSIMLGSVLPDLRAAYGLDYQLGGTLISSQSVGYLGIGLLSGILAVKWGLKRAYLILYYLFAVGFVMLLTGGSPLWLLAAMFLTGISKGGITDYTVRPLRQQIFKNGECIYQSPSITEIRDYCMREVDTLWDQIKRFENPQTYFVDLSKKLWTCKNELLESCRI